MMHAPTVLKLKRNELGQDYLVTDVHGYFSHLEKALRLAHFNPAVDRLFLGGDSVDRGPESKKILDWLLKVFVYSVRGNHEQFCIDSAEFGISSLHLENGGEWFDELSPKERDEYASLFEGLPIAIELEGKAGERLGIVHAECAYRDWDQFIKGLTDNSNPTEQRHLAMEAMFRRTRHEIRDTTLVTGIDRLFVGHSPANPPFSLGNVHYLDGGVFNERGALNLINLNSLEVITVQHHAVLSETESHQYSSFKF